MGLYCEVCPPGSYCEDGENVKPCPSETPYSMEMTYYLGGCSSDCFAGYKCTPPNNSSNSSIIEGCEPGYYCEGDGTSEECPYFWPYSPSKNPVFWGCDLNCPSGYYCPNYTVNNPIGLTIACPTGTYNPNMNQADPYSCQVCPSGSYNDMEGASACILCDPSMPYTIIGDADNAGKCLKDCPAGSYCDAGDPLATNECPAGTYNPDVGASTILDCIPCEGGTYNPFEGQVSCYYSCPEDKTFSPPGSSSYDDCSAFCPTGYYYKVDGNGTMITPLDLNPCPAGYYCAFKPGTIGGRFGATEPTICPADKPFSAPLSSTLSDCKNLCPKGHYCPNQNLFPPTGPILECPQGTYNLILGVTTINLCIPCPAGTYSTSASNCISCPIGTYSSQPGSFYCTSCPGNAQISGDGSTSINNCSSSCPGGYYCTFSYNDTISHKVITNPVKCSSDASITIPGASDSSHCLSVCPVTFYCNGNTAIACPSTSQYSKKGSTSLEDCSAMCPPGYYCPSETKQIECPLGTYNKVPGITTLSGCLPCGGGNYASTTASVSCTNCRIDYPFSLPKSSDHGSCSKQCPYGYYCNNSVLPYTSTPCPAGYYCPTVVTTNLNFNSMTLCPPITPYSLPLSNTTSNCTNKCPIGYYCPNQGVGEPQGPQTPCPAGTFNDYTGKTQLSDCQSCNGGYYNAIEGSSSCEVCPDNSTISSPASTSLDSCLSVCPSGFYCVDNTPIICPLGHYCIDDSITACDVSSPYTLPGAKDDSDCLTECPIGYYCPYQNKNNFTQIPCPPGTFNQYTDMSNASACISCPSGYYSVGAVSKCDPCPADSPISFSGSSVCLSQCPVGYFCSSELPYQPTACPLMSYCDGTSPSTPTPCPVSTPYSLPNSNKSSDCTSICPSGYNCNSVNSTKRALAVANIQTACGPGTYGKNGVCTACPEGQYNPFFAAVACTDCPVATPISLPQSSSLQNCISACPSGYYCIPSNPHIPIPCPPGTYNSLTGSTSLSKCLECSPGTYNPLSAQTSCVACPPGLTSVNSSATSVDQCTDCMIGYYCNNGNVIECNSPNYFSPPGSSYSNDCTSICPPNYFCVQDVQYLCDPLYPTSPPGSNNQSQCYYNAPPLQVELVGSRYTNTDTTSISDTTIVGVGQTFYINIVYAIDDENNPTGDPTSGKRVNLTCNNWENSNLSCLSFPVKCPPNGTANFDLQTQLSINPALYNYDPKEGLISSLWLEITVVQTGVYCVVDLNDFFGGQSLLSGPDLLTFNGIKQLPTPIFSNVPDTRQIVVDTTNAPITSISTSTLPGNYSSDNPDTSLVIPISVNFKVQIIVTPFNTNNTPSIKLNTGGFAYYVGTNDRKVGSSTITTMNFLYIAQPGEKTKDLNTPLDVYSANSLNLYAYTAVRSDTQMPINTTLPLNSLAPYNVVVYSTQKPFPPTGYNAKLPPSTSVLVLIHHEINSIYSVAEKDQIFSADLITQMRWEDSRLAASPAGDYPLTATNLPWRPDISYMNLRSSVNVLTGRLYWRGVGVNPQTGNPSYYVDLVQRALVTFSFSVRVQDFPFDVQLFTINMTTGLDNASRGGIILDDPPYPASLQTQLSSISHPLYTFDTIVPFQTPRLDPLDNTTQPVLVTTFLARRQGTLYSLLMLLPLLLIMLGCYFTFFLSTKSDTRIAVCTAAIIGVLAFSSTLNALLPPVGYITRMSLFIILSFIYVLLTLVPNIFIRTIDSLCAELEKQIANAIRDRGLEMGRQVLAEHRESRDIKMRALYRISRNAANGGGNKKKKRDDDNDDDNDEPIRPENLAKVEDKVPTLAVVWGWHFVIKKVDLPSVYMLLNDLNLVLRWVFGVTFLVFLLPVFVTPSTIPGQHGEVAPVGSFTSSFGVGVILFFFIMSMLLVVAVAMMYFLWLRKKPAPVNDIPMKKVEQ